MRRLKKAMLAAAVLLPILVAAVILRMRSTRDQFDPPTRLKPGVFEIVLKGARAHVVAARAGSRVLLFDAGPDPSAKGLDALLASMGAGRSDVSDIFLTHGHWDHASGATAFPQARVYGGAEDVELAAGRARPEAVAARVMTLVMSSASVKITHPLRGPTQVALGDGQSVTAIPMPGHTGGSYGFLYDGIVVVGNTMNLHHGRLTPPIAAFDAHPEENRKAVRSLRDALKDAVIDRVCTAHGGCTGAGEGRKMLNELIESWGRSSR